MTLIIVGAVLEIEPYKHCDLNYFYLLAHTIFHVAYNITPPCGVRMKVVERFSTGSPTTLSKKIKQFLIRIKK